MLIRLGTSSILLAVMNLPPGSPETVRKSHPPIPFWIEKAGATPFLNEKANLPARIIVGSIDLRNIASYSME